jgi:hypothetical protein
MKLKTSLLGSMGIIILAASLVFSDTGRAVAAAATHVFVDNSASAPVPVSFTAGGVAVQNTVRLDRQLSAQSEMQGAIGDMQPSVTLAYQGGMALRLEVATAEIRIPAGQQLGDVTLALTSQGSAVPHHLVPVKTASNVAVADVVLDIYHVTQVLPVYFDGAVDFTVTRAGDLSGTVFVDFTFAATIL